MKYWNLSNVESPLRISGAVLVLANTVPIIGVMLWGWSIFDIVFLYWTENLIIGFLNVVRMMVAGSPERGYSGWQRLSLKLFAIPFFMIHYGGFCLAHGVFLSFLFGNGGALVSSGKVKMTSDVAGNLKWALAGLFVSHLVSFFINYIARGQYRKTNCVELLFAPYGRIVVLHIAIILGAFAVGRSGNLIYLLIILIIGKTIVDLGFHVKQHLTKGTS